MYGAGAGFRDIGALGSLPRAGRAPAQRLSAAVVWRLSPGINVLMSGSDCRTSMQHIYYYCF